MKDQVKGKKTCPYWSAEDKSCTFRKGGLFIPLADHIKVYCTTPKHTSCLQYKLATESNTSSKKSINNYNRRKYSRYKRKLPVTLVLLNDSGNIVRHYEETSDTSDLSLGGMQLSTYEPLTDDSIINFSFGNTYPTTLQSGLARVKWCKHKKDMPYFTVGLAFQTEQTIRAVRSCFGITA